MKPGATPTLNQLFARIELARLDANKAMRAYRRATANLIEAPMQKSDAHASALMQLATKAASARIALSEAREAYRDAGGKRRSKHDGYPVRTPMRKSAANPDDEFVPWNDPVGME